MKKKVPIHIRKTKHSNQIDYGYVRKNILDAIIDGCLNRDQIKQSIRWKGEKSEEGKRTSFKRTINDLIEDEIIAPLDDKITTRQTKYGLTNKGLEHYTENYKLTSEQLWKSSFQFFKTNYEYLRKKQNGKKLTYYNTKSKIEISIDDYFSNYENDVLNISRKFFNRYSTEGTLTILQDVIKKTKTESKQITLFLSYLTEGKKLELIQKVNEKKQLITSSHYVLNGKKFSDRFVVMLQFQKLIYLHGTKNKEKSGFNISLLGMLYLINSFYKLEKWDEIDKLILKNKHTIPMIFEHWDLLKKKSNLNTQQLSGILLFPFLEENNEIFSMPRISSEQRIIGIQYDLEQLTKKELSHEYNIGLKCVQEWAKSNNCFEYIFSKRGRPRPNFIPIFGTFSKQLQKDRKRLLKTINSHCESVEEFDISLDKINPSIRKLLLDYFEPLRKLGELHEMMNDSIESSMGMIVHDQDIDEKFLPLHNIMAFYFYLLFSYSANSENWASYLSLQLKQIGLNKWWNGWMDALINFDKSQSKKIEELFEIV